MRTSCTRSASALAALATIGEVSDALRDVWGVYQPPQVY